MHDASRRLQDCLADMYEPDWFGKGEMDTLAEVRPGNSLLMHEIGINFFFHLNSLASVEHKYES